MKHVKRSLRAVSTVLAAVALTVIVIIAALAAYVLHMSYIDLSKERSGPVIQIQRIANDPTDVDLLVHVQNVGEGATQLKEDSCLYVNGELVACTLIAANVSGGVATLDDGETATVRYVGGASLTDEKVTVRVITVNGAYAEKSGYPTETEYTPPALSYFTFETIESPQTPSEPFNITIRSFDQYYDAFSGYSGSNILKLSWPSGEINLATTGNFSMGIWTGEVNVTSPTDKATIFTSAQSDPSKWGRSNTFNLATETDSTPLIITVTATAATATAAVLIYYTRKKKKQPTTT